MCLAGFQPVGIRFGPQKIPKCVQTGLLFDQHIDTKWVKFFFFENFTGLFGMLQRVLLARFEPVVMCFGPPKVQKSFENASLSDRKWVKNAFLLKLSYTIWDAK